MDRLASLRELVGVALALGILGACTGEPQTDGNLRPSADDRCATVASEFVTAVNVAAAMDRAGVTEPRAGFLESWLREHGYEPLGSSSVSWVLAVGADPEILEDKSVQALPGFRDACAVVLGRPGGLESP